MSSTDTGMMRPVQRQLLEPPCQVPLLSQVRRSRRLRRVPNRQVRFPQAKSGLRSTVTGTTRRNRDVATLVACESTEVMGTLGDVKTVERIGWLTLALPLFPIM
jgi:hypothetical protein